MSENGMNYLELEYEHLYNMRDQTMLFLKLCPKTTGLAEEMLTWLDQKVKMLGEKLPKYMWPNIFHRFDRLPMNKNSKIDRARLRKEYIED